MTIDHRGLGQTAVAAYWKQRRKDDAEASRKGFHLASPAHPQQREPLSPFETRLFDAILKSNAANPRHQAQVDRFITALVFHAADQLPAAKEGSWTS